MSALTRCSRYTRLFSRSFQSYSRSTAKNYIEQKKNLVCTLTRLTQRQRLTQRSYTTVLSGDNSSLKYNDEASEETHLSSKDYEETHEFVPLPDNYPASPFWKNYDFKVMEKDFPYICKIMYQEIFGRKIIALDRFHEFMACVQQRDSFTEDELLLILKSFGHENKDMAEADKVKWIDYLLERFHSLGIQLTTAAYNEVLRCYNICNHKFSPVEFLSTMEKHGATPNVVTLSRVVNIYSQLGDMKSASNILDHMRKAEMTVSTIMYKNLIMGNFIAGDKETGMKLFRNSSELGFTLNSQMYEAVVLGHAMTGDLDGMKKMLEEAEDNVIVLANINTMILQKVAPLGHKNIIEYVTSKPADQFEWSPLLLGRAVKALMSSGYTDLAFKYFSSVPGVLSTLYHNALATGMSTEDILKYVRYTKSCGLEKASATYFFTLAVSKCFHETAISLLPHVVAEGQMRPQFLWPLIQYCRIVNDQEGMKKLIPFLQTNDYVTVVDWLEPAFFREFGVKTKEFEEILKDNANFNEGQLNAFSVYFKLRDHGWEEAATLAKSCGDVEDIKDYFGYFLGRKMMNGNFQNHWRDILDIYTVTKNCNVGLIWSLQKTVNHQKLKEYILEKGLSVNERNLQKDFLSLFTEEEKEKLITKSYTIEEIKEKKYSELVELKDSMGRNIRFLFELSHKSFLQKDWGVFRESLQKLNMEPSQIERASTLIQMMYFYAIVEDQMDTCLKYLDVLERKNDTFFDGRDVFTICMALCRKGMFQDALRLTKKVKNKRAFYEPEFINKISLFDMEPTAENIRMAKEMMNILNDNQFFENELLRRQLTRTFWNFISESEDLEQVTEGFDFLSKNFRYIPRHYVSIFSNYFMKGDKVGLQAAYDKFTEITYEQHVLLSLTAAFIENGEMLKAKKVLATPGMRVSKFSLEEIFSRWARNGKSELMETFASLCSSVPGDADQTEMKSLQLQALCNKANPDVDECTQFFEKHFENEEDSVPNLHTLKCYARFLKEHRPEKVLDPYVMDLIKDDDSMRVRNIKPENARKSASQESKEKSASQVKEEKPVSQVDPVEKKFKELLEASKYDEAMKVSEELTDEQFQRSLPDSFSPMSKFLQHLQNNDHADVMKRIPEEKINATIKKMIKGLHHTSYDAKVCGLLLEKNPERLMKYIKAYNKSAKADILCASLAMSNIDQVKTICQEMRPHFSTIIDAFKRSSKYNTKMELPEIREQYFAILDSGIGHISKIQAYACAMETLHKSNDIEGVELLAEKAKSVDLNFEEMTEQLMGGKTQFVNTLKELEKSFEEQNKVIPWAPTNTWQTPADSTSLAERDPTDLIQEEDHHTEVIVAEKEHVDITLKPEEHTEVYAVKKEPDEMVDVAKTISDQNEPDMMDKATVITDDSSKGS